MKEFINGVRFYTKATVEISFPEEDVCCYRCPLMTVDYGSKRERCSRTGELLVNPRYDIGYDCPLKFENKENDDG